MNYLKDTLIGITGIIITTFNLNSTATENVSLWVSIICSSLIALTTCAVQCYRLFRDRDKDKEKEKE